MKRADLHQCTRMKVHGTVAAIQKARIRSNLGWDRDCLISDITGALKLDFDSRISTAAALFLTFAQLQSALYLIACACWFP